MKKTPERTCNNCKHFSCYYTIFKSRLSKFGGHCTHDKIYPHIKKGHFTERANCEYWENKSELIGKRRNDIIDDIQKMKNRLDEIVKILSVDDE